MRGVVVFISEDCSWKSNDRTNERHVREPPPWSISWTPRESEREEKDGDGEKEREREGEGERETETKTERETDIERQRQRERTLEDLLTAKNADVAARQGLTRSPLPLFD